MHISEHNHHSSSPHTEHAHLRGGENQSEKGPLARWDDLVKANRPITTSDILLDPQLLSFVTETLGYESPEFFIEHMNASAGDEFNLDNRGANPLSKAAAKLSNNLIEASTLQSIPIDADNAINSVPDNQTFVTLETSHGPVQFSGDQAGAAAKDFAEIYDKSSTFKKSIDDHLTLENSFAIRTMPDAGPAGFVLTPNEMYLSNDVNIDHLSGREHDIFSSMKEKDQLLSFVMTHELYHNIHREHHHGHSDDHQSTEHRFGNHSHGRDQSLFIGAVQNELIQAGSHLGVRDNVDGIDYSDDAMMFRQTKLRDADQYDYNGLREEYGNHYKKLKNYLQKDPPDIRAAVKRLEKVDKSVEITSTNAQFLQYVEKGVIPLEAIQRTDTANVKDLMIQELILESTRSNVFGESNKPVPKETLGELLDHLNENGDRHRVALAAETVYVAPHEVPGSSFA